uniref:Senescence-associated protein n=1 Tax=Glycine max TaxID=3847 RepID=A0A0R0FS47_SOYBN
MIAKLPKLRELSLSYCSLSDHFILSLRPSKFNFSSSLSFLDLSINSFTSSMILQWLSNVTSNLVELDLSGNLLEGSTSNHFGRVMNSLEHLDLSYNIFKGDDFKSFANICTLRSLYATENNFSEDLPSILHNLSSGCVRHSLQDLDLSYNQITGSLPDLSVFSSLKTLVLKQNQLSGKIPEGIRLPFHLESLSIQSNSLEGGIPKSFGNSCALRSLDWPPPPPRDQFCQVWLSLCLGGGSSCHNMARHKGKTNLSHDGLNPAHVPYWWVNNPTLGEFCFTMIGRADIEGSKSNVAMNAWLPQASYPCGNFSDTSSFKFRRTKGSIGHAFTVRIRTGNQNQTSFYPFVPHEISVLVELILGHLRYLLTDVPPHPNSPPDNVFRPDRPAEADLGSKKRGSAPLPIHGISKITLKVVVFHFHCFQLPLILHLSSHFTKSD